MTTVKTSAIIKESEGEKHMQPTNDEHIQALSQTVRLLIEQNKQQQATIDALTSVCHELHEKTVIQHEMIQALSATVAKHRQLEQETFDRVEALEDKLSQSIGTTAEFSEVTKNTLKYLDGYGKNLHDRIVKLENL